MISKKLILTAAHCVYSSKEITLENGEKDLVHTLVGPKAVKVYLDLVSTDDEYDNDKASQTVEKIMPGMLYHENILGHDIALLVLENPVKISRKIAPICLPTFEGEPFEGKKLTVTGWGETSTKWFGVMMTKAFFQPSHAREAEVDHIPGNQIFES